LTAGAAFGERDKPDASHSDMTEGERMAHYAVLSRLTDEGRKTVKSKPERVKEVNEEISKMGAKVVHQFALLGKYDFLTILEAKDDLTMAKIMVELGSRGTLQTMTLSAIPVDDFLAGLKE